MRLTAKLWARRLYHQMKAIPWQWGEVQELDSPCMPLSWPSDALLFTLLSAVLRSKNWSCLHSFPCGALTVLVFGRKRKRRRKRKRKRRKVVEKKLQAIPCSEADALNRITSSKSKKQMKCFPCDEYCSPAHCTNWWLILIDDYLMFRLPMNSTSIPNLLWIFTSSASKALHRISRPGPEAVEEKPEGHAQVAVELLGPVPEIVLWYLLTMVFDAVLCLGKLQKELENMFPKYPKVTKMLQTCYKETSCRKN